MFLLPIDVIGQDGENFDRVTQEGTCSAPHQLLKPRARASQPTSHLFNNTADQYHEHDDLVLLVDGFLSS